MSRINHANQVSIYNYPEHLNPFYEDEQHKRLRFWKIGSSKTQRRDSFNLGSLKNLIPLKAFRLKKKSSTLGINKTSESPPPLRRGFGNGYSSEEESKYSTFDQRFDPNSDSGFLRSARYRSSLQNMNNFSYENRNEPFRRTMQGSLASRNRAYGNGSTNQPNRSYYVSPNGMTPGSSMNSISTNPFDDDTDNESIAVSGQKRLRKKRRAPLPPVLTKMEPPETENVELRIDEDTETLNRLEELTRMTADFETFVKFSRSDIDEKPGETCTPVNDSVIVEADKIYDEKLISNKSNKENVTRPEKLENFKDEDITKKIVELYKSTDLNESTNYELRDSQEIFKPSSREATPDYMPVPVREKFNVLRIDEDEVNETSKHTHPDENARQHYILSSNHTDEKSKSGTRRCVETHSGAQGESEKVSFQNASKINRVEIEEVSSLTDVDRNVFITNVQEESPKELASYEGEEKILTQQSFLTDEAEEVSSLPITDHHFTQTSRQVREKTPLRVLNSHYENVSSTNQDDEASTSPKPVLSLTHSSSKVREETAIPVSTSEIEEKLTIQGFTRVEDPIKFYDDIETFLRKKDQQIDHEIDHQAEPPVPPVRRRSVKDIIESINRSQQLLRVSAPQFERKFDYDGQKLSHNKPVVPPKDKVLLKLSRQVENEKRVNELLADLQDFEHNNPRKEPAAKFPYDTNNFDIKFEKHSGQTDNNNNPTDDDDVGVIAVRRDYNPVPKPRRLGDNA